VPYPFFRREDQHHRVLMMKCWRCIFNAVEYEDQLGLCADCIEILRDPGFHRPLGVFETSSPEERAVS
jgi:hypothetical protein